MRYAKVLLGLAISAAFLIYAFRGQDYDAIWDAVTGVDVVLLLPALALYFLGVAARAFRWSVLLRPVHHISVRELLPVTAIGFMANNVLPFRTGEVVRSYVVAKRHGVRKSAVLATIAVERIFDGLVMLGFILVAASTVTFTSELRHVTRIALVLFGVAVVGLVVVTLAESLRVRVLDTLFAKMPANVAERTRPLADSFFTGLSALRSGKAIGLVAGSSLLAWLLEASMYWTIGRAFGGEIQRVLGPAETLLTTGVANLFTLVPSSPGYVGPFEAGVVAVLDGALGASGAGALSYAIVVHAALWFPITVWGAVEWSRQHLSLRQVQAAQDGDAEPAAETQVARRAAGPTAAVAPRRSNAA